MPQRKLENIRNIGIIAHIDAGKTTVTERLLFLSGAKHRVGRVDHGNTETDEDEEEQNRGITIYSACVTFEWKKAVINLLDTPGHVDFTAEVERCLRVLDGAVVVFSAREGVEAQSETVWKQANKYSVPRVAFINKMDREGASFEHVLEQMKSRLQANPVPIQIPVGEGPEHIDNPFRGVIDLIEMKYLVFDTSNENSGRQFEPREIPDEFIQKAAEYRSELLSTLSDFSEELMELALEEKEIPPALIHDVIRLATLSRKIQPVLCGSALHGIGGQQILDAVWEYLPSPLDRPAVEGTNPKRSKHTEIRKPDPDEPFSGLVFKILPAKTGDLYWIRVYSGTLKANSRALCPGKEKKENIAQLWQIHATRKERDGQVDEVSCGDIVGVIGPRFAVTGDTLCDGKSPIVLENIDFPAAVIEMAIESESATERKKLADTLEMLKRQDPTFRAKENKETGQTLIGGMGELHLEVIKNRLLRDFNLNVKVHKPRVSYRETIQNNAEVTGECHRLVSGQQLFAKLKIRMEPAPKIEGVFISNRLPEGKLPPSFQEAVMEQMNSRKEGGGPIGSFPLSKLKIILLDCEVDPEQSNEMAFSIAAGEAFEAALQKGGPVLLEPIMKLTITTPDEYYGSFVGDLSQRRARIVSTNNLSGATTIIEANAPLAELFGYSNSLRSMSQGLAGSSMEPLEYDAAPESVVKSFAL
ncbi:elongation factor G [Mariniblastus sp.]|jgi:elongation factor G|nr:elongation factor G [Mariniblastus sp.]MDB4670938.1 elongation factor G [Pirellulaceae bacterium]MDB4756101.1 elongation factor G [Mariniblastus sp.]